MKKWQIFFIFTAFIVGIFVCDLYAGEFSVDSLYSKAVFKVELIRKARQTRVKYLTGSIRLNDKNTALTSLEGNLDMVNVKGHDAEPLFEVSKFSQAKIVSTKIEKDKIYADLTLRGVTKNIPFDYVFRGVASDEHGRMKTAVSLRARLNRKDFGIVYNVENENGKPMFLDEIELVIDLQGFILGQPAKKSTKK